MKAYLITLLTNNRVTNRIYDFEDYELAKNYFYDLVDYYNLSEYDLEVNFPPEEIKYSNGKFTIQLKEIEYYSDNIVDV